MAIAKLTIDIDARLANLEAGLKKAEYLLQKQAVDVERRNARMMASFKELGKIIGSAFVVREISQFLINILTIGDSYAKLSQRTGVAVETLSAYSLAAELAGSNTDELAKGLNALGKRMAEAAGGDKRAQQVFRALGISVTDASGKLRSIESVFEDVAEKFKGYEDGAGKVFIANELMSRSGRNLIPVLNQGAKGLTDARKEAEELGIVFSGPLAQSMEQFNDQWERLRKRVEGFGVQVISEVLDPLMAVIDATVEGAKGRNTFFDFLATSARVATETILILGANIKYVFQGVGREIGGIAAQIAALATLDLAGFRAISDAMREDTERARAELDAFERRIMRVGELAGKVQTVGQDFSDRSRSRVGKAPAPVVQLTEVGAATKQLSEYQREVQRLESAIRTAMNLTNEESVQLDILEGKFKKLTPAAEEHILALARRLDALKAKSDDLASVWDSIRKTELETIDMMQEIEDQAIRSRVSETETGISSLLDATKTRQLEENLRLQEELNFQMEFGGKTGKEYAEALELLKQRYKDIVDPVKETTDEMTEFARQAQRNIQDALGDTLSRTLKGDFDSIGEMWKNLLLDMLAQATAVQLNEALFGKLNNGLRSGGALTPFLRSIPFFGGFFATGGTLGAGKWGIAGEAGPELIQGPAQITPISGGRTTIINVAAGPTRSEVLAAIQLAVGASESRQVGRLRMAGVM